MRETVEASLSAMTPQPTFRRRINNSDYSLHYASEVFKRRKFKPQSADEGLADKSFSPIKSDFGIGSEEKEM